MPGNAQCNIGKTLARPANKPASCNRRRSQERQTVGQRCCGKLACQRRLFCLSTAMPSDDLASSGRQPSQRLKLIDLTQCSGPASFSASIRSSKGGGNSNNNNVLYDDELNRTSLAASRLTQNSARAWSKS